MNHHPDAHSVTSSSAATGALQTSDDDARPRLRLTSGGLIDTDERTQMAATYEPFGITYTTEDAQAPMPALSLVKLYIGQYVVEHGEEAEISDVERMISLSDDDLAADFYESYPESVDTIAEDYGLFSTTGGEGWGSSRTSATDVVSFVTQLLRSDPDSPVLAGMRQWQPVAADGYRQDFGLSGLDGVEGAKMGWSNERGWHSSVVFGDGYVMAAVTQGGKREHTQDVADAIEGVEYKDLASTSAKPTSRPATTAPTRPLTRR